ncbi:MAG: serine/threonine-protein kinase [Thermoguttaceae bacterium]|jgi:serine/threonine protein kinase
MTDQKRDPETLHLPPSLRKGHVPGIAELSGLLSSPQDESLVDISGTGLAPSCPAPLATAVSDVKLISIDDVKPGSRIDDFEIISLLGRGAFGAVYLARQISLERQVALKITAWQGGEGRKMARLEHENIVQVFSETAFDSRTRLLCMQYVSGPTLQAVLDELAEYLPAQRSGQRLLDAVDRLVERPAEFDPAAMRNRELLAGFDWVETVCWLGARLAEALDYAHSHGVIHRDIKPGNIMLNQYGRPLLVDFNLAVQQLDAVGGDIGVGGTLAYMAPEHLDAFVPDSEAPKETIAQAADIYSLGVVLYQAATGSLPFTRTPGGKNKMEVLRAMADQRREFPPALPAEFPRALDQVIARCLHPDPTQRFGSARELSAALEGCRHYQAAEKEMPDFGRMRAAATRRPALWLFILALTTHLVASIINIVYNDIRIISHLDKAQKEVFVRIVCWYDTIGYCVGIALALRVVLPVVRAWPLVGGRLPGDRQQIDAARRTAATWPLWAGGIACLCWMPGGIVFPLVLTIASGSLTLDNWAHLLISFVLSGLIAATYSMYFVEWITLCVTYPELWCDRQGFRATAAAELRSVPVYLRLLQVMAGLIPLIGALLILLGLKASTSDDPSFRFLVASLIILGMAGFCLAMFTTGLLSQAWAALTGANEISSRRHGRLSS